MALTLGQLAQHIGAELVGDADCLISAVATLRRAGPGDITFLSNPRYRKYLPTTAASAVILGQGQRDACPVNALVVKDPYVGFARAATLLNPPGPAPQGIHADAYVSETAQVHGAAWVGPHSYIGAGTRIEAHAVVGPGCVVMDDCVVGEGTRLVANVTLCRGTHIGRRTLVHPGVVIGGDGFGFANDAGVWIKVPQLGAVRIGSDVEIGANTTIDCGALDDTVIEDGVKLDNQIQVGHNVHIGPHTVVAACTGIAGSAKIGARCVIGGCVGIVGHIEIADDVQITGMSFVAHSIRQAGVYSSGTPLEPNSIWRRNYARFHQLNDMAHRLQVLEAAIKAASEGASE